MATSLLRLNASAVRHGLVRPRTLIGHHCRFSRSLRIRNNSNGDPSRVLCLSTQSTSSDHPSTTSEVANPGGTLDRVSIRGYRAKILRLCQEKLPEASLAAQGLLNALAEESLLQGRPLANIALHNNCLDAWANCRPRGNYRKAANLLETIEERYQNNPHCAPAPTTISYNIVLNACARSAGYLPEATTKAEELIKKMEQLSSLEEEDGLMIHPDTQSYNLVILAHANQASYKYGAASSAEDWLRYLSKLNTKGGPGPDTISFNTVLKSWTMSPEEKGADRALEILNLMIKLYREGHREEICPDEFSFCAVIDAFAKRNRPREAEEVLKSALSFFLNADFIQFMGQRGTRVDLRHCFNAAINGWALSGDGMAPERSESLLADMRSIGELTAVVLADPDVYSYTSAISAMAKSGREDAPEIVESKLYGMVEQHMKHDRRVPLPNPVTFDCAIRTWFRSSKKNKAERMEALLNTMTDLALRQRSWNSAPKPNTVNLCITAWCRAGKPRPRGVEILNKMEALNCVNSGSYVPLILALLDHGKKNSDGGSVYEAAAVLEKLQNNIRKSPEMKWCRDAESLYNQVISALNRMGNKAAADRALLLLAGMEGNATVDALPGIATYCGVISALSKVPNSQNTKEALRIYNRMFQLHADPKSKVKIDTHSFYAILTYLSNTKQRWAANRSYEILQRMRRMNPDELSDGNKNRYVPSRARCYDKCVQAMARCGDYDSLASAVKMLKEFVNDFRQAKTHDIPTVAAFNVVLKYCTLEGSTGSLELAQEVTGMMEDLDKDGHLNS